jgi:2-C-methyl-D-erythritol 4-phosphate cytidylyltransferase
MTGSLERCWAVVPAAGIGTRMDSGLPKQYLEIAGVTILEHSVRALLASERVHGVVVALHPDDSRAGELAVFGNKRVQRVSGGEQRSDSVLAALGMLLVQGELDDWVLVHDAARPCLQLAELRRLIDRVCATGTGGILAEPMIDTVKQSGDDDRVLRTLDRRRLWRAQTPQMFRLGPLYAALEGARKQGLSITDESSAMELAGHPVQLIMGSPGNLKVTLPADLDLAGWYLGKEPRS